MQTMRQRGFTLTAPVKREIIKIIDDRIREAHVTKEDFSELKAIVRDLGIKTGELAEAQKRTEARMEELAEAQKRTEEEIKTLAVGLRETRNEVGGVSRNLGYAFENEAFRLLPPLLKEKYGIFLKEKMIRAEVGGKEINLLGRAEKAGREILVVGEAKVRLDDRKGLREKDIFEELEDKVQAVRQEYGEVEIARVLITHYARKGFLDKANAKGIIVVQSFEW